MAYTLYSKSHKNCAMCNFWGGNRLVDTQGWNVTVDSSFAQGRCLLEGSPFKGQEKAAGNICDKWQAWDKLK